MRRWAATVAVALLAGAAGCADGGSQAPTGVAAQHRTGPSLAGTEWQLTQVVEASRSWRPPPYDDTVLRFDGEGHFSAKTCNYLGGPVRIDADLLHVGQMSSTYMGCGGPVHEAFVAVMGGAVRWRIDGDQLRLDQPDGRGLRFRVRDTIYRTRDLRPLLRGRRGGGDYQFGWQAGNGLIGLNGSGATHPASLGGSPR